MEIHWQEYLLKLEQSLLPQNKIICFNGPEKFSWLVEQRPSYKGDRIAGLHYGELIALGVMSEKQRVTPLLLPKVTVKLIQIPDMIQEVKFE